LDLGERGVASDAPPSKGKRGSRLPEEFEVTEEMLDWARSEVPKVNIHAENRKVRDHWRAQPGERGVKNDWVATWRNWMRKADEFAAPRGRASPRKDVFAELGAMHAEATAEIEARERGSAISQLERPEKSSWIS
jgi:hypothetical protein